MNGDGSVDASEIKEENNYYPFGLKHKGYNSLQVGRDHKFEYNGMELTEDLGYNMQEMDLRQYDPAIARWIVMDPVTHHSMSPYNAFDNNPVFFADPSGADSYSAADHLARFTGLDTRSIGREGSGDSESSGDEEGDCCGKSKDSNTNGVVLDPFNDGDVANRYPERISFKNVNTAEEKSKFLNQVIDWFGFINDGRGNLGIYPGTIIDFHDKEEKTFSDKVIDFFEGIIGGNSNDHNFVDINDGTGNSVRIGYFQFVADNPNLYTAQSIAFENNLGRRTDVHRIALRSHEPKTGGIPPAIIYMKFTGKNIDFYNSIKERIMSYKYVPAKIIPYKKG